MRKVPISLLANVSAGQGAPKSGEFSDNGIPFIRAGSLVDLIAGKNESDLELVSAETAEKRKLKLYPKGSILFAKSGMSATKDRIYVLQKPAYVVSHLAILKSKDKVHRDYLRLALKQFPPSSLIKDPAYPAIGLGEIKAYEIPIPEEINDQIRIAHLLGKVEGLIAQRKQHLQQLDDLLKSVFLEMFGDDIRDESSYSVITSACDFIDYRGKTPPRVDIGVPLISAKCVRKGYFDASRLDYVTEETYKKIMTRGFPEPNDVLFTTEGATFAYTCRVPKNFSKFSVGQRLITMQCKDGYQPEVLEFVLNDQHIQKKLASRRSGSAALGIRSAELVKVDIPFPNPADQLRFAVIVAKVESLKSRYQQSLNDLESLFGALSQQAFKGELDLSRVPLPDVQVDAVEADLLEQVEIHEGDDVAIKLPDSDFLPDALTELSQREHLFGEWLETYWQQIGTTEFSINNFLTTAQTRIVELHPDSEFELGSSDYDIVKNRVFEALKDDDLTQSLDEANNRLRLTTNKPA